MPSAPTLPAAAGPRARRDRCPGVLRPWPAEDGALVRVRLVGGRVRATSLAALGDLAVTHGDGDLHLTARANLQLRALPGTADGALPEELVTAFEQAGVLPSRAHDQVRNVMLSPQSGLAGGRADLRPLAAEVDRLLLADPRLAGLPGKFLVVLDDGRGDLLGTDPTGPSPTGDLPVDLGLVALDDATGQLRVGPAWGPDAALAEAAAALRDLALAFLDARGTGPDAAWHVTELDRSLPAAGHAPDPRVPAPAAPLPAGPVPGGTHVVAPDGVLDPAAVRRLVDAAPADGWLVVTPWRGVLVA